MDDKSVCARDDEQREFGDSLTPLSSQAVRDRNTPDSASMQVSVSATSSSADIANDQLRKSEQENSHKQPVQTVPSLHSSSDKENMLPYQPEYHEKAMRRVRLKSTSNQSSRPIDADQNQLLAISSTSRRQACDARKSQPRLPLTDITEVCIFHVQIIIFQYKNYGSLIKQLTSFWPLTDPCESTSFACGKNPPYNEDCNFVEHCELF